VNYSDAAMTLQTELAAGMALAKCLQCGCMRDVIDSLSGLLPGTEDTEYGPLVKAVADWAGTLKPMQYTCLGCQHCYAAVAQNAAAVTFPSAAAAGMSCAFEEETGAWPGVVGEYTIVDAAAPVAVSTLGSADLANRLAASKPAGLAIAGKTETENIGIDKLVKNIITNPAIRFLILAGPESSGHLSGKTLLALWEHGVDATGRVKGSPAKRPILRNVTLDEVRAFRGQIDVIDMIGCEDVAEICRAIEEAAAVVAALAPAACGCQECGEQPVAVPVARMPVVIAKSNAPVSIDPAGYFVITPLADRLILHMEHYSYDDVLLHAIEGGSARDVYLAVVAQGWVSEMSHAAYLGKELATAELAMKLGFRYIQDAA
jgi:tetrahydromethanopterin S-methyltransferase subunit A